MRGRGSHARAGGGSVSNLMSLFDVYQVNDILCLSHCLSLSHTSFYSPIHSPTFQSFTHPLILFLTLLLYFSLSLSLYFFLSFSPLYSLSGFLSQAFCLSFSFFMMMIAFITIKSSLVPLIEGLCAQIYFRFEISVVCSHLLLFFFGERKNMLKENKKAVSPDFYL